MNALAYEHQFLAAENALAHGWLEECTDLLEAIRLEMGESSRWANNCGVLAIQRGRFAHALGLFQKAFRLDSSNLSAAVNVSKVLVLMGQRDEASSFLKRLLPLAKAVDPDALTTIQAEIDSLTGATSHIKSGHQGTESCTLTQRLLAARVETVGVSLVGASWMPWVVHDGLTFYTLPVENLRQHRPNYDESQLMELGWKQNIRDIEYRYRASTRPNPPHLIHPIGPGQTIVELGAYLGHYTLSAAKAVGSTGRVLAAEFIPENFRVLEQNLKCNFPQTTQAVHCGIWSEVGSKKAYRQALQANSFFPDTLTGAHHGIEVPALTIDELLSREKVGSVDLLIITINGAELEAFKGMSNSLQKIKAIAVAARYGEPGENRVQSVCHWMNNHGYTPIVVGGDHVYGART